jgi:hypothetical protein
VAELSKAELNAMIAEDIGLSSSGITAKDICEHVRWAGLEVAGASPALARRFCREKDEDRSGQKSCVLRLTANPALR